MTGPQDHDDAIPAGDQDAQQRPDAAKAPEGELDARLEEAEAWKPKGWEPSPWDPNAPQGDPDSPYAPAGAFPNGPGTRTHEPHDAGWAPPVATPADAWDQGEAAAETDGSVGSGAQDSNDAGTVSDTGAASPQAAGPVAWQDRFAAEQAAQEQANNAQPGQSADEADDAEDTAITRRGEFAGAGSGAGLDAGSDAPHPAQPATQAMPVAPPPAPVAGGGVGAAAAPVAGSAMTTAPVPVSQAGASSPGQSVADVAADNDAEAGNRDDAALADGDVADAAEAPADAPNAAADAEPSEAQLAAAFPSTPFGIVSPRASAQQAGPADQAQQAGASFTSEQPVVTPDQAAWASAPMDPDATSVYGRLITPQDDAAVIPGYGAAPPAKRPRGAERAAQQKKVPLWAILTGAVVLVALIVGMILFATEPWKNGATPAPTSAAPTTQATGAPGEVLEGSPAAAVKALGELLVKGDSTSAIGMLSTTATTPTRDVDDTLLGNEAYAAAKNRPTAITIDPASTAPVDADVTRTRVTATLDQGGKPVKTTFLVTRATSSAPWLVDSGSLPTIRVSGASGTTIKVNGQEVKVPGTPGDYTSTRYRVLPGSYVVEGKADTFTSFGKAVTVQAAATSLGINAPISVGNVTIKAERNDAFREAATKSVNAWLAACEKSTSAAPKNCPFKADSTVEGATLTGISWNITTQPELTFHDYDMGAEVVSGSGGTAEIKGKAKISGQEREVTGTVSGFSFRGSLSVSGKNVKFTPGS